MRYMLCLALLCACSSTPKRHVYYCDGLEASCPPEAFVHPGFTPAGAGLPEYRPTEEEPEVPRSPHKRVLPQTPETRKQAGFWASDGPYELTMERPKILGIELPMPDPEPDGTLDPQVEWTCSSTMAPALRKTAREYRAFTQPMRDCLAARLFLWCADEMHEASKTAKYNGTDYDAERMLREAAAMRRARLFVASKCEDVPDRDKIEAAGKIVIQQWMLDLKWRNR